MKQLQFHIYNVIKAKYHSLIITWIELENVHNGSFYDLVMQ